MNILPIFRLRSLVLVCLLVSCLCAVACAAKPKKKKKPAEDKPAAAAEIKPAENKDAPRDRPPPGAPNRRIPNPNATPAKQPAETDEAKPPQVKLPEPPQNTGPPGQWQRERFLGRITLMSPHRQTELMAIANSKDQNRLLKLALDDGDQLRRLVAAHTLTDQKLLAQAAGSATDELVRHAAADRLNGDDPASLKHLAETATDRRVQSIALSRLKAGQEQEKGSEQAPDTVAQPAANKPPGPKKPADLPAPKKPKNGPIPANERRAYAPDLTPPKKPTDPAENTPAAQRERLQKSLIANLQKRPADQRAKLLAIAELDDQNQLAKIAQTHDEKECRDYALMLIVDQPLLGQVVLAAQDAKTRSDAAERITAEDQQLVIELLQKTKDHFIYRDLLNKLQDQELRRELYRKGPAFNPAGPKVSDWLQQHYEQGKAGRDELRDKLRAQQTPAKPR